MSLPLIIPNWAAPQQVKACMTTRIGGISSAPYESLNLGDHVQDDPASVAKNRAVLSESLPAEPIWLSQVHSTRVVEAATSNIGVEADASYTDQPNVVSCVMTADCLPVLFCDAVGTQVAAAHAGWRGLLDGVLEATLNTFPNPSSVMVWFGAAIGPEAFEVGEEVYDAFVAAHEPSGQYFKPKDNGKFLADIYGLARFRLELVAVKSESIYGGDLCTVSDESRFFSFRRDGQTGRMATCIWLES